MFTGIIEEKGRIEWLRRTGDGMTIVLSATEVCGDLKVGDSLAVQGVCLTVTSLSPGRVEADVSLETLQRTNLGELRVGDEVNLERALRPDGRLGGHIVLGHVDGLGIWERVVEEGRGWRCFIKAPREVERYLVEKGSVAVDGVSLTVATLEGPIFSVALIPHTMRSTTLGSRRPGDRVNLEADIVGKYIYRYLSVREGRTGGESEGDLLDKLREGGYL